jgi:hypothetical protein
MRTRASTPLAREEGAPVRFTESPTVVGAKVDHRLFAGAHLDSTLLCRGDDAFALVRSSLMNALQFSLQLGLELGPPEAHRAERQFGKQQRSHLHTVRTRACAHTPTYPDAEREGARVLGRNKAGARRTRGCFAAAVTAKRENMTVVC